VRVRIPDAGRIDAVPGGPDQFVFGEALRQAREAGIPQPLLGPQAPGSEAAGGGERRAA